ncbi:MAG: protein YgfX [Thiogranum sp.]
MSRFDQPLRIEPGRSRTLFAVLVLLYALAIAAWWCVPLSVLTRLLLSAVLAGHFCYLYRVHIAATAKVSVRVLCWDRTRGWRLCGPDAAWSPAVVLLPVFVSYRLAAVRFRTGRFKTRTLVLCADRLPANDFRRLRVRLLQSAHGDRNRKKVPVAR